MLILCAGLLPGAQIAERAGGLSPSWPGPRCARPRGALRKDYPLLFDGFCIDQVELAFARTSILVKYLVHLPPAQPSAVSVENYSVAMSLVLAAEESVSTAPRDIFPHVCDGQFNDDRQRHCKEHFRHLEGQD